MAQPGSGTGHYVRLHVLEEQGSACAICRCPTTWQGSELRLVLDDDEIVLRQASHRVAAAIRHDDVEIRDADLDRLDELRLRDQGENREQYEQQGSPYHAMLERVCARGGFEPDISHVVNDVTVGRALVTAGLCIGVMPELTIPLPRPDVAVRPLPGGSGEHRTVFAVWMRNRRVPAVAPMVRLLAEAAAARLTPGHE